MSRVRITNYADLERSCLYKSRRTATVDVYVWDEESDCAYRQWQKQRVVLGKSGEWAWWSPYTTSAKSGGIVLKRFDDAGKDAFILNYRQAGV